MHILTLVSKFIFYAQWSKKQNGVKVECLPVAARLFIFAKRWNQTSCDRQHFYFWLVVTDCSEQTAKDSLRRVWGLFIILSWTPGKRIITEWIHIYGSFFTWFRLCISVHPVLRLTQSYLTWWPEFSLLQLSNTSRLSPAPSFWLTFEITATDSYCYLSAFSSC